MASTSCPEDVLQASDGKTRFFRLARLLLCGGTTIMRELFDSIIPPANLATVLSSPAVLTTLQIMKNKRLLTSPQWQILFPPTGTCVQSTSFDITLLFKLLRENVICGLIQPSTGWDQLPNIGDISLPADLARIKYFRNAIAHGDEKMELTEPEFIDYWKEVKDALVRIVRHYAKSGSSTITDWETAINKLLTDPLTENDKKNVEELKRELKQIVDHIRVYEGRGFVVRCVVKIASFGAWLGGTIYVLNRLEDNPEILIDYVKYSIIPTGIVLASIAFGSIKLTFKAETLDANIAIWKKYKSGQLKKGLEQVMITDELKALANGKRIELSVEINEVEFEGTRKRRTTFGSSKEKRRLKETGKGEKVEETQRRLFKTDIKEILNYLIERIQEWLSKRRNSIGLLREITNESSSVVSTGGNFLTGAGATALAAGALTANPFIFGLGIAAVVGGKVSTLGDKMRQQKSEENRNERLNKVKEDLDLDRLQQQEIIKQTSILRDLIPEISKAYKISTEEVYRYLFINFERILTHVKEKRLKSLKGSRAESGDHPLQANVQTIFWILSTFVNPLPPAAAKAGTKKDYGLETTSDRVKYLEEKADELEQESTAYEVFLKDLKKFRAEIIQS